MQNFWDFSVWGSFSILVILLGSLLVANVLKKCIPFLRDSLIPSSVLGGLILLAIASIYKGITGNVMYDTAFFNGNGSATLEIITYHTLALGFIASSLKTSKNKMSKKRTREIFDSGVTTVSTYLVQAILGLGVTIIASLIVTDFFPAAGVLLPFGFGQGTGQAMNYGIKYEGLVYPDGSLGFIGGKDFGLTIAALGFLCASIGGVIHLNIMKKKGKIKVLSPEEKNKLNTEEIENPNEIPMQESIDKFTIQIAIIAVCYAIAYGVMAGLSALLPNMSSTIFGFNFLLGVLAAVLVKSILKLLKKGNVVKKEYTNNFLLTRASNFFFDIMVVAGIAVIRLDMIEKYWGVLAILGVVGLFSTYAYNRIVAKTLFGEYVEEQFLAMYGMLTGTASTGVILLREVDGDFKTPASDNLVYQSLPAIVFGFPMMLLADLAPYHPYITLIILVAFFAVMNLILFRSKIFKKKNKK